ncbi:Transcription elongation factor SPT5 [Grifola frondosa]|uniref:Transcription elongation factor SPT5 n=1 Tax=Grifola frondosa TaxID=5627 RepID=A0A1C7LUF1_GRIFR|nr:Transcription elongation factor SPT5 [Grifola frondosa]
MATNKHSHVSQYLDIEAEVDNEDEERSECESQGEDGDEFIDDEGEVISEQGHPGVLSFERPVENDIEEAEKIAQGITAKYGSDRLQYVEGKDTTPGALLPTISDPGVWSLKLPPGRERDAVLHLSEVILGLKLWDMDGETDDEDDDERAELHTPQITLPVGLVSVFVEPRSPGQLYVECFSRTTVEDLRRLLPTFYIYPGATLIEFEERIRVLERRTLDDVDINTVQWVRLRKGLYKSDVAYIADVSGTTMQLFDPVLIRGSYGASSVIQKGEDFSFKNRIFNKHGLEELSVSLGDVEFGHISLSATDIVPFFEANPQNDDLRIDIAKTARIVNHDALKTLAFGDRVRVYKGEQQGLFGYYHGSEGEKAALVQIEHGNLSESMRIPIDDLERYFKIGDAVRVRTGRYGNRKGFVTRIENHSVYIVDEDADEHLQILALNLDFCPPDFVYSVGPPTNTSDLLPQRDAKDPLVGRAVHIQSGPLKGQRGLVRSTRGSVVELELTSQLIHRGGTQLVSRVDLMLISRSRGHLLPLSALSSSEDVDNLSSSAPTPTSGPSPAPVREPTPLPETNLVSLSSVEHSTSSPAWDPNSALSPSPAMTESPATDLSYIHWLLSAGLRPIFAKNVLMLRVVGIVGNQFENGTYDGQIVLTVCGHPPDLTSHTCLVQPRGRNLRRVNIPVQFLCSSPVDRGDRAVITAGNRIGEIVNIRRLVEGHADVAQSRSTKVTRVAIRTKGAQQSYHYRIWNSKFNFVLLTLIGLSLSTLLDDDMTRQPSQRTGIEDNIQLWYIKSLLAQWLQRFHKLNDTLLDCVVLPKCTLQVKLAALGLLMDDTFPATGRSAGVQTCHPAYTGEFISLFVHLHDMLTTIPMRTSPAARPWHACSPLSVTSSRARCTAGCLMGYRYLVSVVGFAPMDIVSVGVSASRNLILALAQCLAKNHGDVFCTPSNALVLLSVDRSRHVTLDAWIGTSTSSVGVSMVLIER